MIDKRTLEIANRLLMASNESSRKAPRTILEALKESFPLKACSFYSYNEMSEILTLRSQVGLSYSLYESFQLPLDSTAGKSVSSNKTKYYEDIGNLMDYRDKELISEFGLKSMITLPLTKDDCTIIAEHEMCNPVIGVICLYPDLEQSDFTLEYMAECSKQILYTLTQAYIHSVNYDQLRIRNDIFQFALSSTDLSSFCHRLSKLLKDSWGYGGVSIFLLDERSMTLRLKGSTGINENKPKSKTFYRLDEKEDVVTSFTDEKLIIQQIGEKGVIEGKFTEAVNGKTIASICIPVFEPRSPYSNKKKIAGVIRVSNCVIRHGKTLEFTSFGWEDLSLLGFVSTIVGVITHLFNKVSRMTEDFERAIHGTQNNLLFVANSLNQLVERSGLLDDIDPVFSYHIPDCIDHVEALSWQMERFIHSKNPGEIECSEIRLAGDVLTKITSIHRSMTKFFNVIPEAGPIFDHSKIKEIPTVYGEEDALITIFRNLTENSIKYSRRNEKLKVWISWRVEGDRLLVDFEDNGIGIDNEDCDYVFTEGYKAENAMRRSTVGAGLGLFQCKKILEKMGGDIYLQSAKSPTIFTVSLRIWRN